MRLDTYNGHTVELPEWLDAKEYFEFQQEWDALWTVCPRYYPEEYQRTTLALPIAQAWALCRGFWLTAHGLTGKSPFFEAMRVRSHLWTLGQIDAEVPFTVNQLHFLCKGKANQHTIHEARRQSEAWEAFGGQPWVDGGAFRIKEAA